VIREPPAPRRAERARDEEHRDPRGHRLHARVEVAADLERERAYQETWQDARGAGRDGER
jgi:hypothetical protein